MKTISGLANQSVKERSKSFYENRKDDNQKLQVIP
jgi:hypothetical protein